MTSRATDFSQQTHEQSSARYSVVARVVVPRFLSSIWLSLRNQKTPSKAIIILSPFFTVKSLFLRSSFFATTSSFCSSLSWSSTAENRPFNRLVALVSMLFISGKGPKNFGPIHNFFPKKRERFFPTQIDSCASLTTYPPLDPHHRKKKDLYHRASTEHSQRQQPFDDARAYHSISVRATT